MHAHWLKGQAPAECAFDLHLSYYGDKQEPYPALAEGVSLSFEKGGKWDGLSACFAKLGDKLFSYDWICLPDDDLWAQAPTWSAFFRLLDVLQPRIAQPALTRNSFYSYDLTLQRAGCAARWTNFVEVMCPAFSREALRANLAAIATAKIGWGLDYKWQIQANGSNRSLAIIDATPVLHTRALRSGALYSQSETASLEAELDEAAPAHLRQPPRAYEAVDAKGGPITYLGLNRELILPRRLHKLRKRRQVRFVEPPVLGLR